jgi:hypothetical protein
MPKNININICEKYKIQRLDQIIINVNILNFNKFCAISIPKIFKIGCSINAALLKNILLFAKLKSCTSIMFQNNISNQQFIIIKLISFI